MANFGGKKISKAQTGNKFSPTECSISASGSGDMEKVLTALTDIQKRLINIEKVNESVEQIHGDLYDSDGIQERLKNVTQKSETTTSDVEVLKEKNKFLRNEMDLLRNVVIRMDRRMDEISKDVVHMRSRSMRDNILIHGFAQFPGEDLYRCVPEAIKKNLGVDNVRFAVIHRNGKLLPNGKPVSITGKLMDRNKKFDILKAQAMKKREKKLIPFYITAQELEEISEERKRLYNISDKFRKDQIATKVVKNQLVLPDGKVHEEAVKPLSNADVLSTSSEEQAELQSVELVHTHSIERQGSFFFGVAGNAKTEADVNRIYKKACLYNDTASSNHRILVYRFRSEDGKQLDGYFDDGEHGAGRRLLKFMKDRNIDDTAVMISRWTGAVHIGYERFKVMEELVQDAFDQLAGNRDMEA
ncbi:hypothetical protein FSP39_023344 [Pinctada imbricata]|uniref:Impact N-terminal domain-containing protein n=1 Tax=Pinctada imbricata TaxID=66713 RepID=A0AA88Y1W8_PINIB|nr:hypothetical protein FSP39_023344 [Pinctada imbricata]